jgi:serpin B
MLIQGKKSFHFKSIQGAVMKKSWLIVLLVLSFSLINCDPPASEVENPELTQIKAKLIEADAEFSINLFREIAASDTTTNVFISPLSVSIALGMAMNGAGGTTFTEMQQTLGFTDLDIEAINEGYQSLIDELTTADKKVTMDIANSVWAREGFPVKQEFYAAVSKYFDAEASELDFSKKASVDKINNWVSDKTSGKIEKIVEAIGHDVVMYLINAVYFKGDWLYSFDEESTTPFLFTRDNGTEETIEMMQQLNSMDHYIDEDVQVLDLPYGDGRFSMTFIRPAGDQPINDFVDQYLTAQNLNKWIGDMQNDTVKFYVPKLELEYEATLNNYLIAMGMPAAFSPSAADLSGISTASQLFISSVLHKTYVKMDEVGTEAAGVTAVEIGITSVIEPTYPIIQLNRSYLMVLREKESSAILFIGKIGHPVAAITD